MRFRDASLFAAITLAAACGPQGSAPADAPTEGVASRLVGTWALAHWEAQVGDQQPTLPFGPDAAGRIMYDAAGNMAVQLLIPDRPLFSSEDWTEGTPTEVETAFEGFFAYYGDYSLDEDANTVTHHLDAALFPNWIGTRQVRNFRFAGDTLVLSTPPTVGQGMEAVHTLWWVKVQ